MDVLMELLPWLAAMVVLIGASAFFSASEAAYFSLRQQDRRSLESGTRSQRLAANLLNDPDQLLSAVLFWNLVVNMAYFATASIVGFRIEEIESVGQRGAYLFAIGSLLAIIFSSEMLPKTVAVLQAKRLAAAFAWPLSLTVQVARPLMPTLTTANLLSRRLLWPSFQPEPYLDVSDLERAIEQSTTDAQLVEQERMVLSNLVRMSDIRVDEWMRPRTQFRSFRPPVSLVDLGGEMTPSGYLLVTGVDHNEITAAIDLQTLVEVPAKHLERHAKPVLYVPWCASVSDAFQKMRRKDRDVVAVVNEFGDTIGILTFEDILDTVFASAPSRSARLLNREAVAATGEGVWQVAGVTSLRRLAREFDMELPYSKSNTLAGAIQEVLQRLPVEGDVGQWGQFQFSVTEAVDRAHVVFELRLIDQQDDEVNA